MAILQVFNRVIRVMTEVTDNLSHTVSNNQVRPKQATFFRAVKRLPTLHYKKSPSFKDHQDVTTD